MKKRKTKKDQPQISQITPIFWVGTEWRAVYGMVAKRFVSVLGDHLARHVNRIENSLKKICVHAKSVVKKF